MSGDLSHMYPKLKTLMAEYHSKCGYKVMLDKICMHSDPRISVKDLRYLDAYKRGDQSLICYHRMLGVSDRCRNGTCIFAAVDKSTMPEGFVDSLAEQIARGRILRRE